MIHGNGGLASTIKAKAMVPIRVVISRPGAFFHETEMTIAKSKSASPAYSDSPDAKYNAAELIRRIVAAETVELPPGALWKA